MVRYTISTFSTTNIWYKMLSFGVRSTRRSRDLAEPIRAALLCLSAPPRQQTTGRDWQQHNAGLQTECRGNETTATQQAEDIER